MLLTNGDVHTNSPPDTLAPALEEARTDELAKRFERQLADNRIAQTDEGLGVVYTHPGILTPELVETYLAPAGFQSKAPAPRAGLWSCLHPQPLAVDRAAAAQAARSGTHSRATADPLFPAQWASWLDANLPRSRGVRLVEGAKLFFPEEFPDIIASEARGLWSV